jgi:hypothetical protein
MFDQAHYVPVLRWKSGERGALRDLSTGDRHLIMPLIELLPGHLRPRRGKDGPVTADDLWVFVEQIVDVWGPSPALLDVSRVQGVPYRGSLDHSAAKMFSALGAAGLHVIPTTWLHQPAGFQKTTREAAKIDNRGVALRVPISALHEMTFGDKLRECMTTLDVSPEHVDLIVEYGSIGPAAPGFSYVCRRIPMLKHWRTFTVLAGSFPPDLMEFRGPGQYEIPRREWVQWGSEIGTVQGLPRRPTFGDYTIQHAIYNEPVEGANPSASIRYASETYWIIMRGQALRRKEGGTRHAQYPANAELLCARKEFAGAHYSVGDEYMWKIGSHTQPGPGTPETWLRAGINHHLVLTSRQIPAAIALTA